MKIKPKFPTEKFFSTVVADAKESAMENIY